MNRVARSGRGFDQVKDVHTPSDDGWVEGWMPGWVDQSMVANGKASSEKGRQGVGDS